MFMVLLSQDPHPDLCLLWVSAKGITVSWTFAEARWTFSYSAPGFLKLQPYRVMDWVKLNISKSRVLSIFICSFTKYLGNGN